MQNPVLRIPAVPSRSTHVPDNADITIRRDFSQPIGSKKVQVLTVRVIANGNAQPLEKAKPSFRAACMALDLMPSHTALTQFNARSVPRTSRPLRR
jgi:hypothetical protein